MAVNHTMEFELLALVERWRRPLDYKAGISSFSRLRGGAGRTRTNHQSVMEHGWCPTNPPGRTPIQIAGSFAEAPAPENQKNYAASHKSPSSPIGRECA